jgi:hypothetical protein
MIGRRAIIGLLMLCALAFCATAASNAAAAQTVFECKEEKGKVGFEDAHCLVPAPNEAGVKFVHKSIAAGTETAITFNNKEVTNRTKQADWAIFNGTVLGIAFEIGCANVTGVGHLTNKAGGSVEGEAKFEYRECSMPKPTAALPTKCKVVEPIVLNTKVANFAVGAEEGLEFTPLVGKPLGEITLEDRVAGSKECTIAGNYKVEGKMRAGEIGARYLTETAKGDLTIGGNEAFLCNTITVRKEGTSTGITMTTGE